MFIKEWYLNTYNSDTMALDMHDGITFEDLFHVLDRYQDIYDFLGVDDSLIRERVFVKLAEILETDYDYVYSQWLLGN